tara:strand:- start:248 stop:547 length:300 start_codon:yes stop_codon:yes gene_type:complete
MNARTYKRIKGTKLMDLLKEMDATHTKFRGCYFWRSPSRAAERRKLEQEHTRSVQFFFGGAHYVFEAEVTASCKNVYYSFSAHVDGKKKNITALRRLLA